MKGAYRELVRKAIFETERAAIRLYLRGNGLGPGRFRADIEAQLGRRAGGCQETC
jgi:hypothetical protein